MAQTLQEWIQENDQAVETYIKALDQQTLESMQLVHAYLWEYPECPSLAEATLAEMLVEILVQCGDKSDMVAQAWAMEIDPSRHQTTDSLLRWAEQVALYICPDIQPQWQEEV